MIFYNRKFIERNFGMNKRRYKVLIIFLILTTLLFLGGCKKEVAEENEESNQGGENMVLEQLKLPQKDEEIVVMEVNFL